MPTNLTGQNISDTYQRLLQISSSGQITDGTGSALPLSFDGNDVTITGNLHALAISSSRVTSSVIYTSGSSTFGDQATDTHTFLGSITASSNISASGNLTVSKSLTFGAGDSRIDFAEKLTIGNSSENDYIKIVDEQIKFYVANGEALVLNDSTNKILVGYGGGITETAIGSSGTVAVKHNFATAGEPLHSQFGETKMGKLGDLGSTSTATLFITGSGHSDYSGIALELAGNLAITGSIITHVTTSGNISSSGNVIAEYYDASQGATGYKLNNSKVIYVDDSSRVFGNRVTVTKISGSSIRLGTPGDSAHVTASGNISASGTIDSNGYYVDGNRAIVHGTTTGITIGTGGSSTRPVTIYNNVTASGNISASGMILHDHITFNTTTNTLKGLYFQDTGTKIEGDTNYIMIDGDNQISMLADSSIQIITPTISQTGNISASGTIFGNVGTFNNLGHITASVVSASGHIQASEIHGQGSGTTQLNVTGQITSSSHISSSGIIYGNSLQIAGNVHVTGSIIGEVDGGTY